MDGFGVRRTNCTKARIKNRRNEQLDIIVSTRADRRASWEINILHVIYCRQFSVYQDVDIAHQVC